jgi:predicted Zn-dependent peptidase
LDDPQYYAFSILNNVMGGSMSSRLFQNIREEKGLAYSVYSMLSAYSRTGYYIIYAGVSHDKIRKAIEGIREELQTLKTGGITEEELSASREQLKSNYIFGQENVASRCFSIGKNLLLLDRVYTPEQVLADLNGVTMEDIEVVKERICDLGRYSAVAVTGKRIDLKGMMGA